MKHLLSDFMQIVWLILAAICNEFENVIFSKRYLPSYKKRYFRINKTAKIYIRMLIFFSFPLPVIRCSAT